MERNLHRRMGRWALTCVSGFVALAAAALGGSRDPRHPIESEASSADRLGAAPETNRVGIAESSETIAQTAWSTAHRDLANSNYAPFVAPRANRVLWTALDGASTLLAPTIGPEGNLYITTGQGPGTSHLHVFNRDGTMLWETPPQTSFADFDSGAIGSAPLIDIDGDVYVGDADQFWAFHPNGTVKWVVPFPTFGFGFVTAIFTPDGFVGGITSAGQVLFYHREDGSLAVPMFDLPGGLGPPGPDIPPGLWAGGLIDPSIIAAIAHAFFGFEVEVANTPSVDTRTGRIFITGSGAEPNQGALYGLDIVDGTIGLAFAAPMVGGSGTSPALSPDGTLVYAVGGDRVLTAFDTRSGVVSWSTADVSSAAAPAVGPEGSVYVGSGANLIAMDGRTGTILWSKNYDSLASSFLRPRLPSTPFPTGLPIARTNSVVTITADTVWVALVLGFEFVNESTGTKLTQPQLTVLAAVNPTDGSLVHVTPVRDTNDGLISIGSDGRIYSSHAARLSSLFYYQIDLELPSFWGSPGPPLAGLTALAPNSYAEHVTSGIEWVQALGHDALAALDSAQLDAAKTAIGRACGQLAALTATLDGDIGDELNSATLEQIRGSLSGAHDHFRAAAEELLKVPTDVSEEIDDALASLNEARTVLLASTIVEIDVQLARCPNEISRRPRLNETFDVVVVGRADFDVSLMDMGSLTLARADGIGGTVRPMRSRFRAIDVTGSRGDGQCSCVETQLDGKPDRVLSFSASKAARTFKLSSVAPDTSLRLILRGSRLDGSVFRGEDCLSISTSRP